MIIYVRSRKDKKAIEYVNKKFYKSSLKVEALSAKGKELVEKIKELKPNDFSIILLGKEDKKYFDSDLSDFNKKLKFVRKKKVRNVKPKDLVKEIEEAKLRFILDVKYSGNFYIQNYRTNFLSFKFGSDVFLIFSKEYLAFLNKILGLNFNSYFCHHIPSSDILYRGRVKIAKISRKIEGKLEYEVFENGDEIDVKRTFKENKSYIKRKENFTVGLIKGIAKDFEVVIPFSGGKDSTTVVLLAKKARIKFTPIFIDTGLEFEETLKFVEYVRRKLKVKIVKISAKVADGFKEKGYEFLKRRECTRIKIGTLYEFVKKNFEKPLMLVGDRISESKRRSFEPEFRKDVFYIYSPIKYWSYFDIQLFFWKERIKPNKLYEKGFYRIGCKVCPFLDVFEKSICKP